jgi:hypothetical protein
MPTYEGVILDEGGAVYNVKAYGATGAGSPTNDRAALSDLITNVIAGAKATIYFPPGSYYLGSALTFPENVALEFARGATLHPADGVRLTIHGTILAGAYPIFGNLKGGYTVSPTANEVFLAPWWGLVGDGTTDHSSALRAALLDIGHYASGGVLYFPPGTYVIGGLIKEGQTYFFIEMKSRMTVRGAGSGTTVFKRPAASEGSQLFYLVGVSHVTVESIGFDYNGAPEFYTAVSLANQACTDVRVRDCRFFDSNPPSMSPGDRWAVSLAAPSTRRVWIQRNSVENGGIQLTANVNGIDGLWIEDNEIRLAQSNAISLVNYANNVTNENIWVSRNRIEDPAGVGIYAGSDLGHGNVGFSGGTLRNVFILHNTIRFSSRSDFRNGIVLRANETLNQAIVIEGNVIDGTGATNVVAIRLMHDLIGAERWFSGVSIRGNTVVSCNTGIWLAFTRDSTVAFNHMAGSTGPRFQRCSDVLVFGNTQDGGGSGFLVDGAGPVRLIANQVRDFTGNFGAGLTVTSTSTATSSVVAALNTFGNDTNDPGTTTIGIREYGASPIVSKYLLNDLRGNTDKALDDVSGGEVTWNFGSATPYTELPKRALGASATWDPGSLAAGASATRAVTVQGVSPGGVVAASLTSLTAGGWQLSGQVTAADTVTVTLTNQTGGTVDLPSGTLRVFVEQY